MIVLKKLIQSLIFLGFMEKHSNHLFFAFNLLVVFPELRMHTLHIFDVKLDLLIFLDDLPMDILHKLLAPGGLENLNFILLFL